jgi:hypothetical protein
LAETQELLITIELASQEPDLDLVIDLKKKLEECVISEVILNTDKLVNFSNITNHLKCIKVVGQVLHLLEVVVVGEVKQTFKIQQF